MHAPPCTFTRDSREATRARTQCARSAYWSVPTPSSAWQRDSPSSEEALVECTAPVMSAYGAGSPQGSPTFEFNC